LDDEEVVELGLAKVPEIVRRAGMEFTAFPIRDRQVPESRRAAESLVRKLERELADGRRVAVHCRAGIGRSATIAASLLALSGTDVNSAFKLIAEARGFPVPDTPEQQRWVEQFVRDIAIPSP
jgi:protein-tyrosine phosphatase